MKENNNFKKIDEHEAPEELKESSLKNTQGSVNTVKSFFSVLDLYITKFFGAIIHSLKDNSNNGISANTGLGLGIKEKDVLAENEDDGTEKGEDWYSDSDAPEDL